MSNDDAVTTLIERAAACLQTSATYPERARRGLPGIGIVRSAL
jgi:hypothetical protein